MADRIRVRVAYALPQRQYLHALDLDDGATVADALAGIAGIEPFSGLDLDRVAVGVFGDPVARERRLKDGDRVEIYRPLLVDPREARRQRVAQERRLPRGRGRTA